MLHDALGVTLDPAVAVVVVARAVIATEVVADDVARRAAVVDRVQWLVA